MQVHTVLTDVTSFNRYPSKAVPHFISHTTPMSEYIDKYLIKLDKYLINDFIG